MYLTPKQQQQQKKMSCCYDMKMKMKNTRNLALELMHDELNFPGSSALIMFGKTLRFHSLTCGPVPSSLSLFRAIPENGGTTTAMSWRRSRPGTFLQGIRIAVINRRSGGLRMIIVRDPRPWVFCEYSGPARSRAAADLPVAVRHSVTSKTPHEVVCIDLI
jgi:hypothetical protein